MERLLCIKIASRGDLLLCAPAFRQLKEKHPDKSVELLVGKTCLDVAEHLLFFNAVRTIDDSKLLAGTFQEKLDASKELCRMLKDYSEVYIFHRDWRYGVLAWWSGVKVRKGFHSPKGAFFLTHPYKAGDREHHVSQYLGMIGEKAIVTPIVNGWSFKDGEREEVLNAVSKHGFQPDQRPCVVLGFGGGRNVKTKTALKSWPLESYLELAQQLESLGYQVVWVGDKDDEKLLFEKGVCGVDLSGRLTVPQTAAVISSAQIVISNDTLMLHLGESLGIPSIGIFGPTDPQHYRPLGPKSSFLWIGERLPCSPCHRDGFFPVCNYEHQCMTGITVEAVLKKVKEIR